MALRGSADDSQSILINPGWGSNGRRTWGAFGIHWVNAGQVSKGLSSSDPHGPRDNPGEGWWYSNT